MRHAPQVSRRVLLLLALLFVVGQVGCTSSAPADAPTRVQPLAATLTPSANSSPIVSTQPAVTSVAIVATVMSTPAPTAPTALAAIPSSTVATVQPVGTASTSVMSPTGAAIQPTSPSPTLAPATAMATASTMVAVAQFPSPVALAPTVVPAATVSPAPFDMPIFDTHLHYSQDAWAQYPPAVILAILEQAGVRRALISSTPDDGTIRLYELAPDRIVPVLRPYRTREDMGTWTSDHNVLAYVHDRLERPIYRGLGEFHLAAGQANDVVPRAFTALSAEQGLFLHAHADAGAVEELLRVRPDARVLWAHAGMSADPATIRSLLDRYPNLWVELALRSDVAPGGTLDPDWGALFGRHPDRFMIGTDTWTPSRWAQLPDVMAQTRRWLGQLPRDLAEKIAFGNADRLFGK